MKLSGSVKCPEGQEHWPSVPHSPPSITEQSAADVHESPTTPVRKQTTDFMVSGVT